MTPEGALYILRFFNATIAMLLWGGYAYLWLMVPCDLREKVGQQLAGARTVAIVALVVASASFLPVQAAFIGSGWPSALDGAVLRDVLLYTSVGKATLLRDLIAISLLASLRAPARMQPALMSCAAGLLLVSLVFSGHAVMHDGIIGALHRASTIVHVLSAGAWFGALLPFCLIVISLGKGRADPQAALAMRRFSSVGHFAVGLTLLSGVCNSFLVMEGWPEQWTRPYQMLLLAKFAVVLAMTATAVFNRYWIVPRISTYRARSIRSLQKGAAFEIALGLIAIGLVSAFGMMSPGGHH